MLADATALLSMLDALPPKEPAPAFVVIIGLPGTGKSHFARALSKRYPMVIVESDLARKTLFQKPGYSNRENGRLFRAIHHVIHQLLLEGYPVILDATNLKEHFRRFLYRLASNTGARLVLVQLTAPVEMVKKRLETRREMKGDHSDADWAVYEKLLATFDTIQQKCYLVDSSIDITAAISKIATELGKEI